MKVHKIIRDKWGNPHYVPRRAYNKVHLKGFKDKADGTTWMADSRGGKRNRTLITLSGNESKTYRYISYYSLRKYYQEN